MNIFVRFLTIISLALVLNAQASDSAKGNSGVSLLGIANSSSNSTNATNSSGDVFSLFDSASSLLSNQSSLFGDACSLTRDTLFAAYPELQAEGTKVKIEHNLQGIVLSDTKAIINNGNDHGYTRTMVVQVGPGHIRKFEKLFMKSDDNKGNKSATISTGATSNATGFSSVNLFGSGAQTERDINFNMEMKQSCLPVDMTIIQQRDMDQAIAFKDVANLLKHNRLQKGQRIIFEVDPRIVWTVEDDNNNPEFQYASYQYPPKIRNIRLSRSVGLFYNQIKTISYKERKTPTEIRGEFNSPKAYMQMKFLPKSLLCLAVLGLAYVGLK